MRYKIIPEVCTKPEPSFEGFVYLKLPKYSEVSKMQREITLQIAKAKKAASDDELESAAVNLQAQEFAFEKLESLIIEVQLKHLGSETVIDNVEDFISFPPCRPIIDELCLKLMFGFAEKN